MVLLNRNTHVPRRTPGWEKSVRDSSTGRFQAAPSPSGLFPSGHPIVELRTDPTQAAWPAVAAGLALCLLVLLLRAPCRAAGPGSLPLTIAVLDLSAAEPGVQADARLVTDMLATALASKKAFRLVERKRLEELLGETEFGGAAAATTVAGKIGAMTGAEAVVAGSIGRVGGELRIDVRLVSVRDGTVLKAASARSDKKAEELERAVERVASALASVVGGQAQATTPAQTQGQAHAQSPFTFTLLARGGSGELRSVKPGSSVRSGEHYKIVFTPDRDCYVYIFQVDASGRIDRLFPMASFGGVQVGQANPVRKGTRYVLPGQDLSFVLDRRSGMERLYCVVSDGPSENLDSLYGRVASARREGSRAREREDGIRLTDRILSRGLSAVAQDRPESFSWESGGAPSSLVSNRLESACPDCAHFIEFVHK